MLSEEPGELPEPPSRWLSTYNSGRFKLRVLMYNVRLLRRPTAYETLGILIGIVGAAGGMAALQAQVLGVGWVLGLLAIVVPVALVGALLWLTRLPTTFRLASGSPALTKRLRDDMRKGMKNSAAFTALERVYVPVVQATNDEVRKCGGSRYLNFVRGPDAGGNFLAVAIPAANGESLSDLLEPQVSVRPSDWQDWAGSFAQERQKYIAAVRTMMPESNNKRGDEDGDNLVLDRLSPDGSLRELRLATSVATYGQIMRTSDSLINEFALFAHLAAGRRPGTAKFRAIARREIDGRSSGMSGLLRRGRPIDLDAAAVLRQLPWRRALHPDLRPWGRTRRSSSPEVRIEDLLVRPTGRAAGIGVALTLVNASADERTAFVAVRGPEVGTYPDVLHVLPAGMCNVRTSTEPVVPPLDEDFLQWTMLGELLEEGKKVKELENAGTRDWAKAAMRHCIAQNISAESPRFTGVAVDLLNLRPEICAVKELSSDCDLDVNWEYDNSKDIQEVTLSTLQLSCQRTAWVQSGVASLALAAHYYAVGAGQGDAKRA